VGSAPSGWDERVIAYLRTHRHPMGSAALAQALGARARTLQRAVVGLVATGWLAGVGHGNDGKPLYRVVEIGRCDWCGLVDHHLIGGECPSCRPGTANWVAGGASANAESTTRAAERPCPDADEEVNRGG